MSLVIPSIENITNGSTGLDSQSVSDGVDWAIQAAALANTYVQSGCLVSQFSGGPNMGVTIASGVLFVAGVGYTVASASVAVGAASTTDRRDLVVYTVGTGFQVLPGTACGTAGWSRSTSFTAPTTGLPPVKPSFNPATQCPLGEVTVTATTTSITTAINIVDKTADTPVPPTDTFLARALTR